jgi:hypothetical protein
MLSPILPIYTQGSVCLKITIAADKNPTPIPPSSTTLRPVSDQIEYGNSIPTLSWCSCAPCLSIFAGPLPGPRAPRHGRRHTSPPAMLRRLSWCTSPTRGHRRSCRSRRTRSSAAKPSPPARTRRPDATAVIFPRQGPIRNLDCCSKGLGARTRGPPCELFCYFMCAKQLTCKIHRKLYETPKVVKLVLLETRIQALQLLLIKFGLKLNTFESILNLS